MLVNQDDGEQGLFPEPLPRKNRPRQQGYMHPSSGVEYINDSSPSIKKKHGHKPHGPISAYWEDAMLPIKEDSWG